jgi:hypothetical protein
MKKNIIIFSAVIAALTLTAFGFINKKQLEKVSLETSVKEDIVLNTSAIEKIEKRIFTDFIYDVGPRFGPIKKGELDKARSINDFLDEKQIKRIVTYKSIEVIIIEGDKETGKRAIGNSEFLTTAQLKLLQSSDYSTNFKIKTEFREKNRETGKVEDSYSTPHRTIVPEKQAEYEFGKEALIEYLKDSSKEYIVNVQEDKLQPAKLFFTVTKKGTIDNVKLDRTSNYPTIDKKMIELISKVPGNWEPAENSKGEKVDQELVISFGLMGC